MNCIKTIAVAVGFAVTFTFALAACVPIATRTQFFYQTPHTCDLSTTTVQTMTISYMFPHTMIDDLTGGVREFQAKIYIPSSMPLTVTQKAAVIWSHGGGSGGTKPMQDWAEATAQACYIAVSLGHKPLGLGDDAKQEFCLSKDIHNVDDCDALLDRSYKPLDIRAMIDWIETEHGEIPIAVGGHSGGANATMTVAGARRTVGNGFYLDGLEDLRPGAFIALSLSGPNYGDFFGPGFRDSATSWDNVTRPMLIATGDGDNKCKTHPFNCSEDKTPWNRQAAYAYMPGTEEGAAPKFQLFIDDTDTFHGIFTLGDKECDTRNGPVTQEKCDDVHQHLKSVAIAFLDSSLRGLPGAQNYLDSDQIENASSLNVSWSRK